MWSGKRWQPLNPSGDSQPGAGWDLPLCSSTSLWGIHSLEVFTAALREVLEGEELFSNGFFLIFPKEGWTLNWAMLEEYYIHWEFNYLRSSVCQSCVSLYQVFKKWRLRSRLFVLEVLACVYALNSSHCDDQLFLPILLISSSPLNLLKWVSSVINP